MLVKFLQLVRMMVDTTWFHINQLRFSLTFVSLRTFLPWAIFAKSTQQLESQSRFLCNVLQSHLDLRWISRDAEPNDFLKELPLHFYSLGLGTREKFRISWLAWGWNPSTKVSFECLYIATQLLDWLSNSNICPIDTLEHFLRNLHGSEISSLWYDILSVRQCSLYILLVLYIL